MAKKQQKVYPLSLKYRPRTLDEVVGRDEIINSLRRKIKKGNLGHLLFEGLQGSGKTLIAHLLIREIQGKSYSSRSHLIVDASKDNKVEKMRLNIVTYMKASLGLDGTKKIVFLDEADNLSNASQSTLRRPLEQYESICQTIMACNYANKIIQPLHSRCAVYTFGAIEQRYVDEFLLNIINKEGITVDGNKQDLLDQIYKHGKGEIRWILNNFMEEARSMGVLNQKVIDLYAPSNNSYAELLFSGKIVNAIQVAYQNPKGNLTGAIDYVYDPNNLKSLSMSSRVKIAGWFTDGLADAVHGVPYHVIIKHLSHKIKLALSKSKKT